jgi:uroporphyrin-3 C-methyltransferase
VSEGSASASSQGGESAPRSAAEGRVAPAPGEPPAVAPRSSPRAPGRDGGARSAAGLALIAALAAGALAVWNRLHPEVTPPDLSEVQAALGTARTALSDAQGSMTRLEADIAAMRARDEELAAAQSAIDREIEIVRNQTLETVDALQRLATGDAFTSHRWMRAEAEHLMQSANIALTLNRDAATALAALEAADERLARLDDPALTAARARLAEEIAALRALPRPDLAGVALTLGSLAARVEQSAWSRALTRVGAALKSMVSVQRTTGGGAPVLAPEERFFLYRNLELELESARLAALRGDAANYRQSLEAARRWLETRFARDDPGVQSALAALAELQGVELVTSWPDISGSLDELRHAESR